MQKVIKSIIVQWVRARILGVINFTYVWTNPMHYQDLLLAMFTALRDWKGVTGECSILMSECREYYNSRSRPGSPG